MKRDATDRSKISSDQKRLFIAVSLNPLSFFSNNPFNKLFSNYKFTSNQIEKLFQLTASIDIYVYV